MNPTPPLLTDLKNLSGRQSAVADNTQAPRIWEISITYHAGSGEAPPPAKVSYFPQAKQDQFRWSCDCRSSPLSGDCWHIEQAAAFLGVDL